MLAVPFTVPSRGPDGRFRRASLPLLHFGMVDSGAQVSCLSYSLLEAFPEFKEYYQSAPDTVKGVGGVSCHVCGELREVPISLGEDQAPGSVVRCTFRVIPREEQY